MRLVTAGFALLTYAFLNYYIGLRGLKSINTKVPINKYAYWVIIAVLASMYFVGMLGGKYLPDRLGRAVNTVGGYWLAAFVYFIGIVILLDVFRILGEKLNILPGFLKERAWLVAAAVVLFVGIVLVVGTYNAFMPRVVSYELNIDKKAGDMKKLKCAMITDVHLGDTIGRDRLHTAVEKINSLNPDIAVITGDLIDREIEPVKKANMLEELKGLRTRFGSYVIMGNHEYYSNDTEEITRMYEESGLVVLRDQNVKVNNSFYLVGREDFAADISGYKRGKLGNLLDGVDKRLPVIVLDHQPKDLSEPREESVDLQLSGHTHAGQFFPINLITSSIFEEDNGHLKDGKFNLIVSCGYGTWGPTVRIGSRSEVLDININFLK
ncbi:metallophosphoesterase [Ruminiclostridium cellulolyticum]|uniref:Metallophosphoesterase n=1 Tax=Ruminiclostridium cellulolyticum (strain ATCC 35319 / DSM 5812 / JCM 6584 / H10) TaxID=394503 RepID=B8I6A5_RUMCH|nr:metallophosphoesterase [Ruminiclostridium cellulolyticum]ACL76870.1 metallophosphoesterase [Ruminiclostridium cellulolyticum H10]